MSTIKFSKLKTLSLANFSKLSKKVKLEPCTCKNGEDLIKNKDAGVFKILNIDFTDAQGQLTLQSVVGYGRNSNSSKLLSMSSLPARSKHTTHYV